VSVPWIDAPSNVSPVNEAEVSPHSIPGVLGAEVEDQVEDQVEIAVSVDILDVASSMRFSRTVSPKPDAQGIYSGDIEGICREDGYRNHPFARWVDAIWEAARLDVDEAAPCVV
jgi:hypothetical protein